MPTVLMPNGAEPNVWAPEQCPSDIGREWCRAAPPSQNCLGNTSKSANTVKHFVPQRSRSNEPYADPHGPRPRLLVVRSPKLNSCFSLGWPRARLLHGYSIESRSQRRGVGDFKPAQCALKSPPPLPSRKNSRWSLGRESCRCDCQTRPWFFLSESCVTPTSREKIAA